MNKKIILENEDLKVTIFSQGAVLNSLIVKKLGVDICLGFNTPEEYLASNSASMGKTIGRCANRIAKGKFTLNGVDYQLAINKAPNSLHGGAVNYGNVDWDVVEETTTKVVLNYKSPDMESGYPGNLSVNTIYELEGNVLKLSYEGVCDKDTLFNMTNHAYFNLDKNKTNILNHEHKINSNKTNLTDENGMARELCVDVKGTPFDFTNFKKIGDVVDLKGKPLNDFCRDLAQKQALDKIIDNIDNNFIYETMEEKLLCELKNDKLNFQVYSDLPDVQIYTGKTIDVEGKDTHYGAYCGLAMEPQFVPNAINYSKYLKPILKANEKVRHVIKYKVNIL